MDRCKHIVEKLSVTIRVRRVTIMRIVTSLILLFKEFAMVKQITKMITVRLPLDLYKRLHVAANAHQQSLNTWCMVNMQNAAEKQRGTAKEAKQVIDPQCEAVA